MGLPDTTHGTGIFAYNWVVWGVNVGIYMAYMECLGIRNLEMLMGEQAFDLLGLKFEPC